MARATRLQEVEPRPPVVRRLHRAGPPETESIDGTVQRTVQRCLRCDRELVVILDVDGSAEQEVAVGRRILVAGGDGLCPGELV